MKRRLLTFAAIAITGLSFAQGGHFKAATKSSGEVIRNKTGIVNPRTFTLDIGALKSSVVAAPQRFATKTSGILITLPTASGGTEQFRVFDNPTMDPELAARYPEIKSYVGEGITNPNATVYFSISPLGFQSMTLSADRPAEFIEPYTSDASVYTVFRKQDKAPSAQNFQCTVVADALEDEFDLAARPNADDAFLRTFRLAMSTTGEYTAYFGGTKAQALAAINNTMTRVNGVFEKDFAARCVLIANTDAVIYTNASTDPYSPASTGTGGAWNTELQNTLTSVIGEANYDVGHLFGATGGGGNAGCIGCVCVNGQKGKGYTSPADGIPQGDNFDIDYVAHELGHQFGANHTFTHSNEGTGVQMEPGSGSTIMGYAGITTKDVQPHSDAYFHAVSIQQVTNNIKAKTCPVKTATGNAIPTANAGADYTVPKSTPFMLTGSATDANGDILTYIWEQMDNGSSTTTTPNATKTSGPNFRSYLPTTSPVRYFPRMQSVLAGATTTAGTEVTQEALSSVARTMNFRFTSRDNRAGGAGNNSDDMIVTVNATAGPFAVTAPNTAVSYPGGSTQTVTWNVAGTTANGVNTANVDILISQDGGNSWNMLLAATPNDGTQAVAMPTTASTQNRIMVKGTNHIFFDVSNANFTITSGGTADTTAPSAPTNLTASGTTQSSTNLSWTASTDNVGVTGYDVYQNSVYKATIASTTYAVSGLSASTAYSFYVIAKDAAGNSSAASNTVNVTTLPATATYCASQGNSIADERIGRVQMGTIDNTSPTTSGYSDFTSISTSVNKGQAYSITVTPQWTGSTYPEGFAVWIDYNNDKDFDDAGELVWSRAASTATPATGTFTIPTTAALGATRMRVSMKYNGIPTACEAFSYGEVEDYTVNIQNATADSTAPSAPTGLAASGTTTTSTNLSWTASTDNVGVTGYDVYQNSVYRATTSSTSYAVTALSASTTYSFYVIAKDAAGNASSASNTVNVTTLANTVTYCASQGNSVADEKIQRVQFNTIDNSSTGGTGYTNFTAISTNVTRGSAYTISITPQWTSTKYNEGYAVFIDYNGDGDFTDSGETAFTRSATQTTPVTGSITIPATATLGATRMRVSMKYNGVPTACETFSYGQVEDYTVNIGSGAREGDAGQLAFSVYPNPVSGNSLFVNTTGSYRILSALGQEIAKGEIGENGVFVGDLASGIYLLEVQSGAEKGVKRFIKE